MKLFIKVRQCYRPLIGTEGGPDKTDKSIHVYSMLTITKTSLNIWPCDTY